MSSPATFVVGLGASAGGLEALERFFDHCPCDSGGAFVLVMHLSRNFKSRLEDLLGRHTSMPVRSAENGAQLAPNTVYIAPLGSSLEVTTHALRLKPILDTDPTSSTTNKIDLLFRSIALYWGRKGGTVVLSGSGVDGSVGTIEAAHAGGFTSAQAPETSKFDSMPLSAIATNAVRAVEAPEQLPQTTIEGILLQLATSIPILSSDHDDALGRILDAVIGVSKASAGQYKHSTFERRVRRRMMDLDISSLEQYAERVVTEPTEARQLSQALLIGVTEFFRDESAFRVVSQQIVPDLIRRAQSENRPIRVWVPGCATGEEAYSLTMLFLDAISNSHPNVELQLFATDLKKDFLATAAKGEYTQTRIEKVPDTFRQRFFKPSSSPGVWTVTPELRKPIAFAPHDILTDPPFTRLDLISCRNLLIYFSVEAQQRIMSNFAFGLVHRGYLLLGPSETIGGYREVFDYIDARNRIFRRTSSKRQRPFLPAPKPIRSHKQTPGGRTTRQLRSRDVALQPAYSALLTAYAPPSLLISSDKTLLHSFGSARRFVRPPEGAAHLDVAEMVDPALKTAIIAGTERALRDRQTMTFSGLRLEEFPQPGAIINLSVQPLYQEDAEIEQLLLLIEEVTSFADDDLKKAHVIDANSLTRERITELEAELQSTRETLQSTIEEIETTNEELQASNEELISLNEELQSTNEELSSVNEELYSLNTEYHRQNDDLGQLNEEFDLLLKVTEIGVIFFDASLAISRFAGLAGSKFQLSESDLGRPFSTFRSPFVDGEPHGLLADALGSKVPVEAEMQDSYGDAWLLRAVSQPDGRGAVLTIINIERLRAAELEARHTASMLSAVRAMSGTFYFETNESLTVIERELDWFSRIGNEYRATPTLLSWDEVAPDHRSSFLAEIEKAKSKGKIDTIAPIRHAESNSFRYVRFIGEQSEASVEAPQAPLKWRVSGLDVDTLVRGQIELKQKAELFHTILESSPAMFACVDSEGSYQYANERYMHRWGQDSKSLVGSPIRDSIPKDIHDGGVLPHVEAALDGQTRYFDLTLPTQEGRLKRYDIAYTPLKDHGGKHQGFAITAQEVSRHYVQAEAIQRTDKFLAWAARHSPYAVLLVDEATQLVEFANEASLESLGVRTDRGLPSGVKVSRLTPEWGEVAWSDWLKSLRPGESNARYDVAIFDQQKSTIPADLFTHIVEENGQRKAVVQAFVNGERSAAIQDLRERSRQLAISNRDLEQFASVVAHDLRAPLRHVRFFATSLREAIEADIGEDARYDLARIDEGVIRMGAMIEALLGYARLGRERVQHQPVSLMACIQDARTFLQDELIAAGADFEISASYFVHGDTSLLTQLFQNLISNAIKYRNTDLTPQIGIDATPRGDFVLIRVWDNGIGIKPEFADRIFELFQRLHNADAYPGLGIGLAACRRICEIHRGDIHLDKDFEGGTSFLIRLPTAKEPISSDTAIDASFLHPKQLPPEEERTVG